MEARMIQRWWVFLFLFSALLSSPGQETAASARTRCLETIAKLESENFTLSVYVATAGKESTPLLERGADVPLIPASNMKILTAGAALLGAGGDHALLTDLIAHGEVAGGVLDGVLRLRGEGDPTLEAATTLPALVERVKAAGIERITGDILVDDRLFDQEFRSRGWPEDNGARTWMAQVAALALGHGTVVLRMDPAATAGEAASVSVEPPGGGLEFKGTVKTVAAGEKRSVSADRDPEGNTFRIGGQVPVGGAPQQVAVAVHDPALIFGRALVQALRDKGIVVEGTARRPNGDEFGTGGRLLARIETVVRDLLPGLLKPSQNHRSDMLLKHLGALEAGRGSFASGATAVKRAFAKHGCVLDDVVIADGSGLSYDNRLSAVHLARALQALWRSPVRDAFKDALPSGGESGGTLRSRLQDVGSRVRAKTGTLGVAAALSGYLETKGGGTLVFAFIINAPARGKVWMMRDAQDAMVRALAAIEGPL
jgi:D-alanyl-D-alanine carboxypeptidase/D-alanyl-D-alanine-endopeptidase (penicillin-binding protein 4)